MTFMLSDNVVHLSESCPIEEAEALHQALCGVEFPIFDLSGVGYLHTAIVQLIIASGATVRNLPDDAVLTACFVGRSIV